jgi:hypothetical protein
VLVLPDPRREVFTDDEIEEVIPRVEADGRSSHRILQVDVPTDELPVLVPETENRIRVVGTDDLENIVQLPGLDLPSHAAGDDLIHRVLAVREVGSEPLCADRPVAGEDALTVGDDDLWTADDGCAQHHVSLDDDLPGPERCFRCRDR